MSDESRDRPGRYHSLTRIVLGGLGLLSLLTAAACNPYVAAVSMTYGVATSERSLTTQASDTAAEAEIKAALLESPVAGTGSLKAWCRRGVVVLAGVVPTGSQAGSAAVQIASGTSGVRRVETFFVDSEPSPTTDLEIEGEVKAAFIADPNVIAGRVSVGVYAGHVVLVGVVSDYSQAQRFVDDTRSVAGVVSVRSYIQTVD